MRPESRHLRFRRQAVAGVTIVPATAAIRRRAVNFPHALDAVGSRRATVSIVVNAPVGRASRTRPPLGGLVCSVFILNRALRALCARRRLLTLNAPRRLVCSLRFAPLVSSAPLRSAWCHPSLAFLGASAYP